MSGGSGGDAALLINLSFVPEKPTGLAVYALNLVRHLPELDSCLLSAREQPGQRVLPSPARATSDFGKGGHGRRLWWTQFQVPRLYRQMAARLFFSPLPEAPLGANCQTVVTVHDLIPLHFPRWGSPATLYSRHYLPRVIAQARHLIFDSESTLRDVYQFFGPPPGATTVVPLAYDEGHYRWLDLPRQPYFLYVGRHEPYKNLGRLIEAFSSLKGSDTELWIAGAVDPRYTPQLQAQAEALGVCDRTRFLSYLPYAELPRLLNQALALVFPSLWEGFGLPVLEAMACGTPVITSNLSSLPEVAGEAALLIDPYRVGELAEAMAAVADRSSLWARLHRAGLERAQRFSWAKTGRQTGDILQRYL